MENSNKFLRFIHHPHKIFSEKIKRKMNQITKMLKFAILLAITSAAFTQFGNIDKIQDNPERRAKLIA
jgi:hypothetical protein